MPVSYEWTVETEDVTDTDVRTGCPAAASLGPQERLVLVRTVWNNSAGVRDRQWAYVEDGKLPLFFDRGVPVPPRYHEEFSKQYFRPIVVHGDPGKNES